MGAHPVAHVKYDLDAIFELPRIHHCHAVRSASDWYQRRRVWAKWGTEGLGIKRGKGRGRYLSAVPVPADTTKVLVLVQFQAEAQ